MQAQNKSTYWQQKVDYKMDVNVNVHNFQYQGTQQLIYTNNSPDTLNQVFYHLYYNAFQPGSEMDMRLQQVPDPDSRMVINKGTKENPIYESRIAKLKSSEIGYLKVISLKQNGNTVKFKTVGTILQVTLNEPIKPGEQTTFKMVFKGQLPVHIRRAGRNNNDGVALSMAQWYPKLAEYDYEGWHADPYIAREFFGVWGNYDVTIHIDKDYTIGGTGNLQNPNEIGHGYTENKVKLKPSKDNKLAWHFIANKVHDFTWAADNNYKHDVVQTKYGTTLHFFYKNEEQYKNAWKALQPYAVKALGYYNTHIGVYPYKQYSIIQGGDGGMEYPMCTLITGGKTLKSILGTMFHEFAHEWFQFMLATNESEHSWMDEGFTTYISNKASAEIVNADKTGFSPKNYGGYFYVVKNNLQEPLTTHADRFNTNVMFSVGSYTKGSMFLNQLNYIIGKENLANTLKNYFEKFKFKHPSPSDFIRTAEKVSGLQLRWYLNEWVETTHTIDYAVRSVKNKIIKLSRIGKMPMPIDVKVDFLDGTSQLYTIPLRMMYGTKPTENRVLADWPWANPLYEFKVNKAVKSVEIDPSKIMADVDRSNNLISTKNIINGD